MSYLFILKRFEIWLLVGVVVALLIFAFQPVEDSGESGEPTRGFVEDVVPTSPEVVGDPEAEIEKLETLRITRVEVEPTEEGRIVEVTLLARAKEDGSVEISEETLQVATEEGLPVPHFFAPFQAMQTVGPEEMSLVTVRLWLANPADALWLNFEGERAKAELPTES